MRQNLTRAIERLKRTFSALVFKRKIKNRRIPFFLKGFHECQVRQKDTNRYKLPFCFHSRYKLIKGDIWRSKMLFRICGLSFYLLIAGCLSSICWGTDDDGMILIDAKQVHAHPHSAVLSILCVFPDAPGVGIKHGTGFIIDKQFAITAAHVLTFSRGRTIAKQVFCYVERHAENEGANKIIEVKKCIYPRHYFDNFLNNQYNPNSDYALLYFDEDICANERLPLEPMIPQLPPQNPILFSDSDLALYPTFQITDHHPYFSGYPGEELKDRALFPFEKETQWLSSEKKISGTEFLKFSTQVYPGMSGGPIRVQNGDNWKAIGVIIAHYIPHNGFYSFIREVFDFFRSEAGELNEKTYYSLGRRFTQGSLEMIAHWKGIMIENYEYDHEFDLKAKEAHGKGFILKT